MTEQEKQLCKAQTDASAWKAMCTGLAIMGSVVIIGVGISNYGLIGLVLPGIFFGLFIILGIIAECIE